MKATDRSRASAFGSIREDLTDESGAFPIGEGRWQPSEPDAQALAGIEELAPEVVSLIPEPPRESMRPRAKNVPPSGERAQLVIEDLTLRPDNPYLASSLIPPPKSAASRKRSIALIAAGMLSAAAVGALIELVVLRAHVAPPVEAPRASAPVAPVSTQPVVAKVAAPAPVAVVAPSIEVAPTTQALPVAPVAEVSAAVVSEAAAATQAPAVAPVAVSPAVAPEAAPVVRQVAAVPAALPTPPEPVATAEEPALQATTDVAPSTSAVTAEAAVPAAEKPPVPERLTREQVAAGFDALLPALEQCAQGAHGVVQIDAAIAGTGRVAHAVIAGAFVGTPEGSCMARAVRSARFPESAQERMNVRYPISL